MWYLAASKGWLLNEETWQFMPTSELRQGCDLDVPFYMWDSDDRTKLHNNIGIDGEWNYIPSIARTLRQVGRFKIKNLLVVMNNFGGVEVTWDSSRGTHNLSVEFHFRNLSPFSSYEELIDYAVNGSFLREPYDYEVEGDMSNRFRDIIGVRRLYEHEVPICHFSYGMSPIQLNIVYKKRLLGKSLVWMLGHCAILLGDDLSFDSFVILQGAHNDTLVVNKFVVTENPYVVKCLTMLG